MGLSGIIPTEISRLQDLEYLTLFENEITGQIPTSIGVIQNLRILDLYSNQLEGNIPIEVYDLSNLLELRLGDNVMDGTISKDIQKLSSLRELSLKSNYFSGTLPTSFVDLTQLRDLSIQQNEFVGQLYVPSSDTLGKDLIHDMISFVFLVLTKYLYQIISQKFFKFKKIDSIIHFHKIFINLLVSNTWLEMPMISQESLTVILETFWHFPCSRFAIMN